MEIMRLTLGQFLEMEHYWFLPHPPNSSLAAIFTFVVKSL
jgi:hypothetical protein